MLRISFILAVALFCLTNANPAAEHHFRAIVNSNECLRECMQPVQATDMELSVFKRANYSDYFLNLDTICDLITNARHCIDNCHIKSNPFALLSMNAICSEKSRQDAKLLESCFANVGAQVNEQCIEACGNYEQQNDEIRVATSTYRPDTQQGLDMINQKTNAACATMKCSARCSVDNFNHQCGHLANGQMAGTFISEIVESILATHRMDLAIFGLLQKMRQESQPECNYLHTGDVLFDPVKDMASQQALGSVNQAPVEQQPQVSVEQQLKRTSGKLYIAMLKKQLRVLDKQLELMDKQEHKMDNEMRPQFVQQPMQELF